MEKKQESAIVKTLTAKALTIGVILSIIVTIAHQLSFYYGNFYFLILGIMPQDFYYWTSIFIPIAGWFIIPALILFLIPKRFRLTAEEIALIYAMISSVTLISMYGPLALTPPGWSHDGSSHPFVGFEACISDAGANRRKSTLRHA